MTKGRKILLRHKSLKMTQGDGIIFSKKIDKMVSNEIEGRQTK